MGNRLDIDLNNKVVLLDPLYYNGEFHLLLCNGGFGCDVYTSGDKIGGNLISNNQSFFTSGNYVLRLATYDEIENKKVSQDTIIETYKNLIKKYQKLKKVKEKVNEIINKFYDDTFELNDIEQLRDINEINSDDD